MENQEVKTEVAVKKVAPHYMDINPPKQHITVVRPNYCQSKKEWSTRVINEKGEQIKCFTDKDKEKVLIEWRKLMNDFHKVEKAKI